MPDPDTQRFEGGLNRTRDGMRLCMAVKESQIAIAQITKLLTDWNDTRHCALQSWRRAYIFAQNRASGAIDHLWDAYRWPEGAARTRDFEWRPTSTR